MPRERWRHRNAQGEIVDPTSPEGIALTAVVYTEQNPTTIIGGGTKVLANAATATGTQSSLKVDGIYKTFAAVANGSSGAYSATVDIEVSNDDTNYITMGTISLSGTATTADVDGFAANAAWKYVRANVTAISGTGATCTVTMGG